VYLVADAHEVTSNRSHALSALGEARLFVCHRVGK
jgi:hypothetical protein